MNAVSSRAMRRWLPLAVAGGLWLAAVGCQKDQPPAQAQKKKEPVVVDGLSEDWRLDNPECAQGRKVDQVAPGSPEAVLRQVFEAATGPDDEAGFQKFYATLDPEQYTEEWAKTEFWGRIRQHVEKYVGGPQDLTFIVCREDRKSDEQTKLFVYSKEKSKTPPPYGLRKRDGQWRIEFFTP